MHGHSMSTRTTGKASDHRLGKRPRWCRVRVETEGGTYVGSLRMDSAGLRQLVDDDRAYLPLWNALRDGSPAAEEFLALHKAAIRSVLILGHDPAAGRLGKEV